MTPTPGSLSDLEIFRLDSVAGSGRLPYSLKVLLENLLRHGEDEGVEALANWDATAEFSHEIAYTEVFEGDEDWNALDVPVGDRCVWGDDSTYVKRPPYFEGMPTDPPDGFEPIEGARCLALLGDSVTTDSISPAGAIKLDSPADPLEDGAQTLAVRAGDLEFEARVRVDTPDEWLYLRHGGIPHYVLRSLAARG